MLQKRCGHLSDIYFSIVSLQRIQQKVIILPSASVQIVETNLEKLSHLPVLIKMQKATLH